MELIATIFSIITMLLLNLGIIALSGFLCWHFNSGWGVLVLLFMFAFNSNNKDKNKE